VVVEAYKWLSKESHKEHEIMIVMVNYVIDVKSESCLLSRLLLASLISKLAKLM
jgi:hypothetical protein